jgi:hypothetical protein
MAQPRLPGRCRLIPGRILLVYFAPVHIVPRGRESRSAGPRRRGTAVPRAAGVPSQSRGQVPSGDASYPKALPARRSLAASPEVGKRTRGASQKKSRTHCLLPIASPGVTSVYTLEVRCSGDPDCIGQDQMQVAVTPLPAPDAGPEQTICCGDEAVLDAGAAEDPGCPAWLDFRWLDVAAPGRAPLPHWPGPGPAPRSPRQAASGQGRTRPLLRTQRRWAGPTYAGGSH